MPLQIGGGEIANDFMFELKGLGLPVSPSTVPLLIGAVGETIQKPDDRFSIIASIYVAMISKYNLTSTNALAESFNAAFIKVCSKIEQFLTTNIKGFSTTTTSFALGFNGSSLILTLIPG